MDESTATCCECKKPMLPEHYIFSHYCHGCAIKRTNQEHQKDKNPEEPQHPVLGTCSVCSSCVVKENCEWIFPTPEQKLKNHIHAWTTHITKNKLSDRTRFVAWLMDNFTVGELAIIIDSEISRAGVYQTYLNTKFPTGEAQCEEQGS